MAARVRPEDIQIEPWTEADLHLLQRQNAPEMTAHLGGPESADAVLARHQRCLDLNERQDGQMFRIVLVPEGMAVGGIGLWESDWQEEAGYETGWGVLPEYQGRGIATIATRKVIDYSRSDARFGVVFAFPGVDNDASNAICRKAEFKNVGEGELEYPKGSFMRCAVWRLNIGEPTDK
jgi:RimJ/RimL family protein N-acetyltransferase